MTSCEEDICSIYVELLRIFIRVLMRDELRVLVVIELLNDGPLSFRALGRRLKVNNSRLRRALKDLSSTGLITEYVVHVASNKYYKFYHVNKEYIHVLRDALNDMS